MSNSKNGGNQGAGGGHDMPPIRVVLSLQEWKRIQGKYQWVEFKTVDELVLRDTEMRVVPVVLKGSHASDLATKAASPKLRDI